MPFTYILKCVNGHFYVGSTSDLKRRLRQHVKGQCRSTKDKLPTKLVYKRKFELLAEARKYEFFLKRQ